MKKRMQNMLYMYILIQPFIDLITSLMVKFLNINLTIGTVIRGIAFIAAIIYILFISKSKYQKYLKIYLLAIGLYVVGYFLTKQTLFTNYDHLYTEIIYLFKYSYTIIMLPCIFMIFDEFKPNNRKIFKILQINLFIYCFIIFLANITGTAFATYETAELGNTGWFYSGNEISVTVALLFPLLYLLINKATSYKALVYIVPIIFGIECIGTKTSMLGIILPTIIFLFYYLIRIKQGKAKQFIMALIVLFIIIISAPNLPVIENIKDNIASFELRMLSKNRDKDYSDEVVSSILLSNRDFYAKKIARIYKKASQTNKLFGIGFTNREEINNKNIEKLIEMDFHDIFYRYGILGILLYVIPFIIMTVYIFKRAISLKFKVNKKQLTLLYISYIGLFISLTSGHILGSPAVAIYLDLIFVLLVYYFKYGQYKIDIEENKVTILMPSLENIENIQKITSSIPENYNINILVTFKDDSKLLPKFNSNVKINYLIDEYSYKKEFAKAVHSKQVVKIIRYTYNLIKMKWLNYIKNTAYIEESDNKYIITTNYYHNKLVGKNKNRDIVAIHIEFNKNYEKKYINKVLASCNNSNYLILPNAKLHHIYQEKLKNKNTICKYINHNSKEMWSNIF